jgi:TonB family protein
MRKVTVWIETITLLETKEFCGAPWPSKVLKVIERNIDPEYPAATRLSRISGTVVIDAIIDERGNVVQARVVSGHPLLVAAALRAVKQWKYEPSSLNGQPVSVELEVQVHFHQS